MNDYTERDIEFSGKFTYKGRAFFENRGSYFPCRFEVNVFLDDVNFGSIMYWQLFGDNTFKNEFSQFNIYVDLKNFDDIVKDFLNTVNNLNFDNII